MVNRVGDYWFMLPEANQARKAIWEATNPHTGRRRIDEVFPPQMIARKRDSDMKLELLNGSSFQVVGSDNYNSLVGSPPVGLVFSEYALCDPLAWAFLRPILTENGGFAWFNSTVRGPNHFKDLFDSASSDPEWFTQLLAATRTDVFTPEQLRKEELDYASTWGAHVGKALFEQEFLSSWDAAILGAYYSDLIRKADEDGRITSVPVDDSKPVNTAWDLGIGDATSIWCYQIVGRELRIVDNVTSSGVGLDWYVRELKDRFSVLGDCLLPHDAEHNQITSGKSTIEVLRGYKLRCRVVPKLPVQEGIQAVRSLLPRCVFDKVKCKHGIDALRQYRAEWDQKNRVLKPRPVHDWASHPADAIRYLAVGFKEPRPDANEIDPYRRGRSKRARETSWMAA